jgi:acyl carrier protein
MENNIGIEILALSLDLDVSEIQNNSDINNLPEWDSLSHIKIVLAIEEKLERNLTTEEIIDISDVNSINKLFNRGCV